jgi:hypothetical protein
MGDEEDYQPAVVQIDEQTMHVLLLLAKECAQDVLIDAGERYQGDHPTTIRRRDNDSRAALVVLQMVEKISNDFGWDP